MKHPLLEKIGIRTLLCLGILAAGFGGMKALAALKEPPQAAQRKEQTLRVEVIEVQPVSVPVMIAEHGVVRALNEVTVTPEVAGTVIEVHPRLEVGEIIPAGEVLFRIDPRDYEAQVEEARATVDQLRNALDRIRIDYGNDQARQVTLTRTKTLAESEYQRLRELFATDDVGTQSGVDAAERVFNQARDAADQLARGLEVYPIQIKEAEGRLRSSEAQMQRAETALERTALTAPFNARIKEKTVAQGQYVSPGRPVLTLADDSTLEISVPIDSLMARHWLRFNGHEDVDGAAWFTNLVPVECEIRWTEDKGGHRWIGQVNRVERFDQQTRTLTVAVRIEGANARSRDADALPLVDGMFCEVTIPGQTMENVFALPHWAVGYEGTVYLAEDNRLKTQPVTVVHKQGDFTYVSEGLLPGAQVIVTRLVTPLENSLLEVTSAEAATTLAPDSTS